MVVVLRVTVDFSITHDCESVGHHKKKKEYEAQNTGSVMHPQIIYYNHRQYPD